MNQFRYPLCLKAGEESADLAIKLAPSKKTIRISFLWGENEKIQVLGANMIEPNIFEFPPHEEEQSWYLKYCVSQRSRSCSKAPYITVHKLESKLWPIYVARGGAVILFLFPILILLARIAGNDFYSVPEIQLGVGSLAISLPVTFILLFITWSTKVTEFIKRLFSFSTEIAVHYQAKGVSEPNKPMVIHRPSKHHQDNRNGSTSNRVEWSDWHSVF